jgi:hypothetical protein
MRNQLVQTHHTAAGESRAAAAALQATPSRRASGRHFLNVPPSRQCPPRFAPADRHNLATQFIVFVLSLHRLPPFSGLRSSKPQRQKQLNPNWLKRCAKCGRWWRPGETGGRGPATAAAAVAAVFLFV